MQPNKALEPTADGRPSSAFAVNGYVSGVAHARSLARLRFGAVFPRRRG